MARRYAPLRVVAVAAAIFLGGFADLVRGGISWSATLLIAAYVTAIPAAILFGGRRTE